MGFTRMVRKDDHIFKMSHLIGYFKKGQIEGLKSPLELGICCLRQALYLAWYRAGREIAV
jgi:hypothetical protein